MLDVLDAQLLGPDDTPYAGGVFDLVVTFPSRYPLEPPNVKFRTKIYHPNISHDGNICLDVLNLPPKGSWSPASSLRTVLLSIQLLLSEPNPNDPLDADAAREYLSNKQLFLSRAAELTRRCAVPGRAPASNTQQGSAAAMAASSEDNQPLELGPAGRIPTATSQPIGAEAAPGQGAGSKAGSCETQATSERPIAPSAPCGAEGTAGPAHAGSAEAPVLQNLQDPSSVNRHVAPAGQIAPAGGSVKRPGATAQGPPGSRLSLSKRSKS